jgi:hypothetical protein
MKRDEITLQAELNRWEDEGGSPMRAYTSHVTAGEHMSQLDAMMAWELGTISEGEAIHLFQGLVDNGLVWRLQGMYGRQAMRFINAGLVSANTEAQVTGEGISDFYAMGLGVYD